MKTNTLAKICINLLLAVVAFSAIYCVNFAISWINSLDYGNMLAVTLPFVGLAIVCLIAFGIIAERAEEKRQMEIRRRKRMFVLKRAYKNRNNIIYLKRAPKLDLFREAC